VVSFRRIKGGGNFNHMGGKKDKKSRKQGFLREILKNGVVGDSKNGDFIGLIRFWLKMRVKMSKNLRFFEFFCKNERVLSKNCKKLTVFEHFFCTS
jgi:hypothetical protein